MLFDHRPLRIKPCSTPVHANDNQSNLKVINYQLITGYLLGKMSHLT